MDNMTYDDLVTAASLLVNLDPLEKFGGSVKTHKLAINSSLEEVFKGVVPEYIILSRHIPVNKPMLVNRFSLDVLLEMNPSIIESKNSPFEKG